MLNDVMLHTQLEEWKKNQTIFIFGYLHRSTDAYR